MSDIGPGGFDMSQLLAQVQQAHKQLQEAQTKAAAQVVEGVSGGGVVRIRVSGDYEFLDVTIDPVATDDVEMLQDLVVAAARDAVARVRELSQEALGDFGGILG